MTNKKTTFSDAPKEFSRKDFTSLNIIDYDLENLGTEAKDGVPLSPGNKNHKTWWQRFKESTEAVMILTDVFLPKLPAGKK